MNATTKQAFLARLTTIPDTDPLWVGLKELIRDMTDDTVAASSRSGLAADDRAFNDGRQSMALDLAQALDDAWVSAQNPPG